jgi:hypothetical protein
MPYDIRHAKLQNRDKDSINLGIFLQKLKYSHDNFRHTNNFILIFCDNIIIKKDNQDLPLSQSKYFYKNCGESDINGDRQQGHMDPVLKLYRQLNPCYTSCISDTTQIKIHFLS